MVWLWLELGVDWYLSRTRNWSSKQVVKATVKAVSARHGDMFDPLLSVWQPEFGSEYDRGSTCVDRGHKQQRWLGDDELASRRRRKLPQTIMEVSGTLGEGE